MPTPFQTQQAVPAQAQAAPDQAPANPAEVAAAQQMLTNVRKLIASFHNLRRRNNEVAAGLRPSMMMPDQARFVIAQNRNPEKEKEAVAQLRQLIAVIYGREPTRQEVQMGIPAGVENGMGVWPAVAIAGITAAGASVHAIFSYLRAREENIFNQTATPIERMARSVTENIWAITALGAVGAVGYMYWKGQKEKKDSDDEDKPRPRPVGNLSRYIEKLTGAKSNPEPKEEEEEYEDDEEDEEVDDVDDREVDDEDEE